MLERSSYVLGHVALARSEEYLKLQSVQRIPAVPKDKRDTIFHEYFLQTDNVDPIAPPLNPAAPAEKRKAWNLKWGPLSWMADITAQRPVTRFSLDLWMSFFCRSVGVPTPMLQAHAMFWTMCLCKNFSLDPQRDHMLACKKHTGATRGHNHVMDVLAQLDRNTGYSRGSYSHLGPGGASAAQELRVCQNSNSWHRAIPFFGISDWRAMHIFCGLNGQWQRTSNIVCGVSECRPLRRKFVKTASALMHGIQNTKVTSTPVSMHMTAKGLCARVARPCGKTSRITVRYTIAASEQTAVCAVATCLASSSFQGEREKSSS